jgi:hypothetical protein
MGDVPLSRDAVNGRRVAKRLVSRDCCTSQEDRDIIHGVGSNIFTVRSARAKVAKPGDQGKNQKEGLHGDKRGV